MSAIAITMMLSVSITITPIMHIAKFSRSILTAHAAVPSFCMRPLESNIDPIVYFTIPFKRVTRKSAIGLGISYQACFMLHKQLVIYVGGNIPVSLLIGSGHSPGERGCCQVRREVSHGRTSKTGHTFNGLA